MVKAFMQAYDFKRREVYRSSGMPGYAAWVSFFPGQNGCWYIGCEEVSKPDVPLPKMSRDKWYSFGLPSGYDKSDYQMEMVILESKDGLYSWEVKSRERCRFQHTAGQFGQARTPDDRFLRFVWKCYSLEYDVHPGEIYYVSNDEGKTWFKQEPFHSTRFFSYPHRLRTLKDGTLVLALPFMRPFCTEHPRTAHNSNADTICSMNLCFSFDQGRTWSDPLPIYGGQNVSETDFVELPSGDLLCINSSIWKNPGRQKIYREGNRFIPDFFEKAVFYEKTVPETVAMTEDCVLVGCMRGGIYSWSNDLGLTWYLLEGIPERITEGKEHCEKDGEVYQPWINYLGDGRFVCAGHYGGDDRIDEREFENYIMLHDFRVEILEKMKNTELKLKREYDVGRDRWSNNYVITLTSGGMPLEGMEIGFWYAERWKPGYDRCFALSLEERMKMGGELVKARTDKNGVAVISLPRLDNIEDIHHNIQLIAWFNTDGKVKGYKPVQTDYYTFYSNWNQ